MPDFRRWFVPGGTYFFTLVTEGRARLFAGPDARRLLGDTIRHCQARWPFVVDAIALLPDHLHAIWRLPAGDDHYSGRVGWIKKEFTKAWLSAGGSEQPRSRSRVANRRRGVWQRRFWEHVIRDERDYENHFDYLHYNPVKHGLVRRPGDWPWTTFGKYVAAGWYPADWGEGPAFADRLEGLIDPGCEPPG
ncbi:MAG: transposase [Gemmataceae bacterium]